MSSTARQQASKPVGKKKDLWSRLARENQGADLVEYSLLLVLNALIVVSSIQTVGTAVSNAFRNAAAKLTTT
jgi:Flp pilus assembly pilin Flp